MWSSWDRLTAVSTSGLAGSEEDDDSDFGWDFFGLRDPSAMRDFMSACDYCLSGCSDDDHSLGDDNAPVPASRVDIPRELAVVPVPMGGQDT
jgi:hypothetical protein